MHPFLQPSSKASPSSISNILCKQYLRFAFFIPLLNNHGSYNHNILHIGLLVIDYANPHAMAFEYTWIVSRNNAVTLVFDKFISHGSFPVVASVVGSKMTWMTMPERNSQIAWEEVNIRLIFLLRTRVCDGDDWTIPVSAMEQKFRVVVLLVRFSHTIIEHFLDISVETREDVISTFVF